MKKFVSIILFAFLPLFIYGQCTDTEVAVHTETGAYAEEMSWHIYDGNGVLVGSFQGVSNNSLYDTTLCLLDGCYLFEASDSYGDGWNGGSVKLSYDDVNFTFDLPSGSNKLYYFGINEEDCTPFIPGCTDPASLNYNSSATADDGSCLSIQDVLNMQEFDTIQYNGSKDNRISWVIQNRGSSFANREEFVQMFKDDLLRSFTLGDDQEIPPYAQYRNFFNLYAVWWPDAPSDQEWWHFSIIKQLRDAIFLPWANNETGWVTWFSSTKHGGGGGAGRDREARVGDGKMYGMGYETFLHEFSHTMPGLPDEYSASGEWSGGNCWESGNTTGFTTKDDIPWRLWIEDDTPLPTPYTEEYLDKFGAFEGALTNYFGCYRPTARDCFMGAGGFGEGYGEKLCAICQQRTLCYLYKYVNVIENHSPEQMNIDVAGSETIHFSADVLKPEPNTQKYEWFLNGKLIAEGVEELDLSFASCKDYELKFAVTDTNSLLRYDPKFEDTYPKPYREIKWTITQTDVNTYDLDSDVILSNPDCTGEMNGSVEFLAFGGTVPYSIHYEGVEMSNPLAGLTAGAYDFDIVDANGCGVTKSVELFQDLLLNPKISSEFVDGKWNLSVEDANYENNSLSFQWSTGATTAEVEGLIEGNYSIEITTDSGCIVQKSITLTHVESDLKVDALVLASTIGENTGKVYLDINGGIPPYTIYWEEKINRDITNANTDNIEASGTTWGHLPEYAFNDDLGNKWLHFVSENAWISYFVEGGAVVNYYTITSADDVPGRDPKDWLFQGSDDGISWITLDEQMDQNFNSRFEKKAYSLENTKSFNYYRFYVTQNHGDGSIQLQQLEFIGTKNNDLFVQNDNVENLKSRSMLPPGAYAYFVKDANFNLASDTVYVGYSDSFLAEGLKVIQYDECSVSIENPGAFYQYYWLADEDANEILHIGTSFRPSESGNYYVAMVDPSTNAISSNRKGFAVSLEELPEVEITEDNNLAIINPDPQMDYSWYDSKASCLDPLHVGTEFLPDQGTGFYYVAAQSNIPKAEEIDPNSIPGILIRMDASDLNGDGILDDPAPATSSTYDWLFENGNRWADGSWFAFRGNHQNGLGVADFATIWYQSLIENETGYQSIVMAYEENPISFPETAPFKGLSKNIPRHADESQLFSNSTPAHTLDGTTILNGELVDPLTTPNPLDFCILATRMTEISNEGIKSTDTKWEGKIGEIILWENALSDDEMIGVSEYLRKKWISIADLESPKAEIFWESPTSLYATNNRDISFFPNPSSQIVQVHGLNMNDRIQIISADAFLRQTFECYSESLVINVNNLPVGIYIIRIIDNNNEAVFQEKLIKQ